MTNQPMVKNDPIKSMREENRTTTLFEGVVLTAEDDGVVIYHAVCDDDIVSIGDNDDMEFSEVLDKILEHLGECDVEDDEEDYDDDEDEEE